MTRIPQIFYKEKLTVIYSIGVRTVWGFKKLWKE